MLRRKIMSADDWDSSWNYKQGLLENSGFMELSKSSESGDERTEMTSLGEFITSSGGFVKFKNTKFKTIEKGVAEYEFIIKYYSIINTNGLRFLLSNGTKGLQVSFASYKSFYDNGRMQGVQLPFLSENDIHKIKIIFNDNGKNKIYFDDELIFETNIFSTDYCLANSIYQQSSGQTYLRSVKYKYNRI